MDFRAGLTVELVIVTVGMTVEVTVGMILGVIVGMIVGVTAGIIVEITFGKTLVFTPGFYIFKVGVWIFLSSL